MDEELKRYLVSITTPENASTLLRAVTSLDQLGINAHHDDIAKILHTVETHDAQQNLLDMFTLLTVYASSTLQEFGVEVADEVPLTLLNEILEAFTILPNYGDPKYLLTILDGWEEIGPEETLCELLEAVSPKEWYVFIPYVENVSEDLVRRLSEVLELRLPSESEERDIAERRDRLLALYASRPTLLAMHWLREGGKFFTSLETLLTRYETDLLAFDKKPKEMAEALVSLVVVSDTPIEDFTGTLKDLIEDFVEDPLLLTKTFTHITELLKEIHLEKA